MVGSKYTHALLIGVIWQNLLKMKVQFLLHTANPSFENINIQISRLFVLLKNYGEKKPEY